MPNPVNERLPHQQSISRFSSRTTPRASKAMLGGAINRAAAAITGRTRGVGVLPFQGRE